METRKKCRFCVLALRVWMIVITVCFVKDAGIPVWAADSSGTSEENWFQGGEALEWKVDAAGTLMVRGTGDFYLDKNGFAPWYQKRTSIKKAVIKAGGIKSTAGMFMGCSNLAGIDLSGLDTAGVTDMKQMFYGCSSLASIDVRGIDTSNVTDMKQMFRGCSSLHAVDVSGFHTSGVVNMKQMFYGCSSLSGINISGFITKNVTDMQEMFRGCSSLKDIDVNGFQTAGVTSMRGMFNGCSSLADLNLSALQLSAAVDMQHLVYGCTSLKRIAAPKTLPQAVSLPAGAVWKNENGTVCTQMDAELPYAMTYVRHDKNGKPEASYDSRTDIYADTDIITANAAGVLSVPSVKVGVSGTGGFTAQVQGASWISIAKSGRKSRAADKITFAGSGTVYVFLEKNKAAASRTGTIVLTNAAGTGRAAVRVIQDALQPALFVDAERKMADQNGAFYNNAFTVQVQKTGSYTVEAEQCGWLWISDTDTSDRKRGYTKLVSSSDGTFYLAASENKGEKRTARVTVTHSSGKPVRTITVTQLGMEGAYLDIDRETAYFDGPEAAASGAVHVFADKDTAWTVKASAPWITLSASKSVKSGNASIKGSGMGKFYILVKKNKNFQKRAGSVTVHAPGRGTYEIYVSQPENMAEISELFKEFTASVSNRKFRVGKTSQITFFYPEGMYASDIAKVIYATSSKRVAAVDQSGRIKGGRTGKAVVSVKVVLDAGLSKTIKFRIKVSGGMVTVTG